MATTRHVTTIAPADAPAHDLVYWGLALAALIGVTLATLGPNPANRIAGAPSHGETAMVSEDGDANSVRTRFYASAEPRGEVGVSILQRGPAFH